MKASLWYYPNTSKKSKKSGKIPMYMRVIYNGKSETRLNADVTEKELLMWNNVEISVFQPPQDRFS